MRKDVVDLGFRDGRVAGGSRRIGGIGGMGVGDGWVGAGWEAVGRRHGK